MVLARLYDVIKPNKRPITRSPVANVIEAAARTTSTTVHTVRRAPCSFASLIAISSALWEYSDPSSATRIWLNVRVTSRA